MKKLRITTALIALAVSVFSVGAQAKPNLSIAPISEAQANEMRTQEVSRGSSVSTTVTMGRRDIQSRHQKSSAKATVKRVRVEDKNQKIKNPHLIYPGDLVSPHQTAKHAVAMYKVRKGDSLYKIAKHYGTTVERIMRINQLRSTTIHAGQTLKV
ncbi:MAG: LysM peptidoglycan-binding domain-containing protein [Cocleimonas sp.]|nr:LysM peptidoglycan-binding domain-containing protein [Cocleimonas sp.]